MTLQPWWLIPGGVGNEEAKSRRIEHRAGEAVPADALPLLDHQDGELGEIAEAAIPRGALLLVFLHEIGEMDGGGKTPRARAHHQTIDLEDVPFRFVRHALEMNQSSRAFQPLSPLGAGRTRARRESGMVAQTGP
jgi:hypothetical protein